MPLQQRPPTNGYSHGSQRLVAPDAINALSPTDSRLSPQSGTPPLQINVDDWDLLFEAIQSHLCATVLGQHNGLSAGFDVLAAADKVRDSVLGSVNALEKLHRALRQERSLHDHPSRK